MSGTRKTDAILRAISRLEGHGPYTDEELEGETFRGLYERDFETFGKAREAIKTLTDLINGSGNDAVIRSAIVREIVHTHRHLQGELLNTLLLAFGDLATLAHEDEARWTDGRNAWVYTVLQKMVAKLDTDFYFHPPR